MRIATLDKVHTGCLIAVELVSDIDLAHAHGQLCTPASGAVTTFIGTVRNHSHGKEVTKLVFEAYEAMALKEMNKLALLAAEKWQLNRLLIQHTTGEKKPGEVVVFIGVAATHRDEAFAACRFLIDELKRTVPIWKKEYYIDNSVWINAHP